MKVFIPKLQIYLICLVVVEVAYPNNSPFVLNRFGKSVDKIFISGAYSHNNLQNPLILMRIQGQFERPLTADEYFNLYYFQFGVKNLFLEIGHYLKNTPTNGVYAKRWLSDGSMVIGYDKSKVRIEEIKSRYYCLQATLYKSKYFDFSSSISFIPFLSGEESPYLTFIFSKSSMDYSYTFGLEAPTTFFFLPVPTIPFASISYHPIKVFSLFWELKNSPSINDTYYGGGFTNVIGININIINYINLSIFHHYFYDKQDHEIPYTRHDKRLGFQMSFQYIW